MAIAGDAVSNVEWIGIGTISVGVVVASLRKRLRAMSFLVRKVAALQ